MIPHLNLLMLQHHIKYIGNNKAITLTRFIWVIKDACGVKAKRNFRPMQSGDVPLTYADIDDLVDEYGFNPSTSIEQGISNFVDWYLSSKSV